jgi:hypothetical protein
MKSRQTIPFSPEQLGRVLKGSMGPAFDIEDLALALGDGSMTSFACMRVHSLEDLRRAVVAMITPDKIGTGQTMRGVVGLMRMPKGLPIVLSLRETTALLLEVMGEHAHIVIAASSNLSSEASIDLNLWISTSDTTREVSEDAR